MDETATLFLFFFAAASPAEVVAPEPDCGGIH
jgi:hypothetical protein